MRRIPAFAFAWSSPHRSVHSGKALTMSDATHDIFAEWRLPIWLTLSLVFTAAVYIRGWLAIRKTRPEQFTDIRALSFLSGLAVLWIAVGSPMDGFAYALLSAHMVEHLLLM